MYKLYSKCRLNWSFGSFSVPPYDRSHRFSPYIGVSQFYHNDERESAVTQVDPSYV